MRSLRPLLPYFRPYRWWAILAPLFMVLEVTGDLMLPRLVQTIIDQGIARNDMSVVIRAGAGMLLLALLGIFTGGGCGVFAVKAAQGFGADLRGALFRHVQALSFGNLDELETGGLITRLTNDVSQVQDLVMILLRSIVRAPLLLVGGLIMATLTSPRLARLFLPLIPIVALVVFVVIRRSYPLFSRVQKRLDALNTVLQENLSGIRVVKAYARTGYEQSRFGAANDALMSQNIGAARVGAVTMPLVMIALNGGLVAALWLGGVDIKNGDLQVGQLIAFNNYLMQTLMALIMVSMVITQIARAEASAHRVRETLETRPFLTDGATEIKLRGRVEFRDVSFHYDASDEGHDKSSHADAVLKNISFQVEAGQTVAILGATGAGKSSLVQLIPRFYDATEGSVTIDGHDVRDLSEQTLRRGVAVALQEAVLFSGTIRDNIAYGRPDANDDEVRAAARDACADEFIARLPDAYQSVVGARGVNLSGGQKQRLAIARALLMRPAILILDDSTSAVDVATEARIQRALESYGQTRFIVAQRISAARGADLILVLDDGELVAQGTHEELMENSAVYREIQESQTERGVLIHGE